MSFVAYKGQWQGNVIEIECENIMFMFQIPDLFEDRKNYLHSQYFVLRTFLYKEVDNIDRAATKLT